MKYGKGWHLPVLGLLSLWMASCQTLPDEAGGEISGVVLHHVTGKPVEGVTVALGVVNTLPEYENPVEPYLVDGQPLEYTTKRDGTFRFQGVEPGQVLLMTRDDTMAAIESEVALDLAPGEHKSGIEVRVSEGASVSGTIYNDGYYHGVGGVTVQVIPHHEFRPPWLRVYEAVTEADGTFHIGGITGGNYIVRSSPTDGFQQTSISFFGEEPVCSSTYHHGFPMAWGTHYGDFEFTVAPGAVVRGTVVDEAGHPVPGAEVFVFNHNSFDKWNEDTRTNDQGVFLLYRWEKLEMPQLIASKDGMFSEWLRTDETVADYGPIQLTLQPGASLNVRLKDEDGRPIDWPIDLTLSVVQEGEKYSPTKQATRSANDHFAFPPLPAATYRIRVSGEHWEFVRDRNETVTLRSGDTTELTLIASKAQILEGPTISGRIVDSTGNPVPDAVLTCGDFKPYEETAKADGRFTFRTRTSSPSAPDAVAQPPRPITLTVTANGFKKVTLAANPGDSGIEVVMERTGLIRGRVVDAESGAPIEDYTITAFECRDASDESRRNWRELKSAALEKQPDGHFELTGVAVSPVFLEADAPTHAKASARVAFAPGIEAGTVDFRLQRAGFVRGEVVDARGNPFGRVHVFARAGESVQGEARENLSGSTMTDPLGAFFIPFESSGRLELFVGNPHEIHKQTVDVPVTGLDGLRIVVPDALTVRGRVTCGGKPVEGARVVGFRESATTNAQGYYVLTDVPPGEQEFTCEFTDPDGAPFMRRRTLTFTAKRNGPDLNIEMAPATVLLTGRVANADADTASRITVEMPRPDGELILETFPVREDGTFQIGPLPEGTAWVVTGQRGKRRGTAVTLREGEASDVLIDFAPSVHIEGTIQRNGVEGPLVIVIVPGDPDLGNYGKTYTTLGIVLTGSTHVDGDTFSIENLAPGEMTLLCWSDAKGQSRSWPPAILGRTTVDVGPKGLTGILLSVSNQTVEDSNH